MTGIRSGWRPEGRISERMCSKCSSEPSRAASPHAYPTARSEWGLDSEGDSSARARGGLTFMIHNEGFQAAGLGGLDLAEDVVEVVERFDPGIDGVGMVPRRRGGDDLEPVLVEFLGVEADVVGDDDDLWVG